MRLSDLLHPDRVAIIHAADATPPGAPARVARPTAAFDKAAALSQLATMLASGARVTAADLERVLLERESLQSTGIGDGVAIPHGAMPQLEAQYAALLLVPEGVEFAAIDGLKVTILFAVIGPKRATGEHLKTLARISRLLRNKEFRDRLIHSPDAKSAYALVDEEEGDHR